LKPQIDLASIFKRWFNSPSSLDSKELIQVQELADRRGLGD